MGKRQICYVVSVLFKEEDLDRNASRLNKENKMECFSLKSVLVSFKKSYFKQVVAKNELSADSEGSP